jgi:hypothetical protein
MAMRVDGSNRSNGIKGRENVISLERWEKSDADCNSPESYSQ